LKKNIEKEIKHTLDKCFVSHYSNLFNIYLQKLSPETRNLIRNNKELDRLFDLFLDFTIDSSQHIDYLNAKEAEKNIDLSDHSSII
jgi:hypothetical protein